MVDYDVLQIGDEYELDGKKYVLLEKHYDDDGRVVGVVNKEVPQ